MPTSCLALEAAASLQRRTSSAEYIGRLSGRPTAVENMYSILEWWWYFVVKLSLSFKAHENPSKASGTMHTSCLALVSSQSIWAAGRSAASWENVVWRVKSSFLLYFGYKMNDKLWVLNEMTQTHKHRVKKCRYILLGIHFVVYNSTRIAEMRVVWL